MDRFTRLFYVVAFTRPIGSESPDSDRRRIVACIRREALMKSGLPSHCALTPSKELMYAHSAADALRTALKDVRKSFFTTDERSASS